MWNPFDVTDGRDPEPAESVRRNAPEAYRARQLRAVTLADYVRRAEEVPGVVARGRALRLDRQLAHGARRRSIPSGTTELDGAAARATSPRISKRCG